VLENQVIWFGLTGLLSFTVLYSVLTIILRNNFKIFAGLGLLFFLVGVLVTFNVKDNSDAVLGLILSTAGSVLLLQLSRKPLQLPAGEVLSDQATQTEERPVDPELEEAVRKLINGIYPTCSEVFEDLEHKGKIIGNGHHIAQKVLKHTEDLLRERWIRKPTS